ncbi:DUF378 domain-containing protein [Caldimonas sp. KR1-144]|uniref:DUF378 domain-containing protein n=1 Tax=Caldimonas sp. KR1-144 TaxID=3400911 RepID=UPI003C02028F
MERLNPSLPPLAERTSLYGFFGLVALALLILGGLNWALLGLIEVDLVAVLFGPMTTASRTVYALFGVAAVYALSLLPRVSRMD